MLTRTACSGNVDAHPMSKHCIASTHLWLSTTCVNGCGRTERHNPFRSQQHQSHFQCIPSDGPLLINRKNNHGGVPPPGWRRCPSPATTINRLLHNIREPTHNINIVPSLVGILLLSTSKFVEASYTTICNKDAVNYYGARTTKIMILADTVLKGWQCPHMNLWRVPLIPHLTNLNTDTIILDYPSGQDNLNTVYYTTKINQLTQEHVALQI